MRSEKVVSMRMAGLSLVERPRLMDMRLVGRSSSAAMERLMA